MSDSPPWEVGPWVLEADLAKVAQQWTSVHEVLSDADLYALRAADVSAWSCGEQAGHILLVAESMARQIEGNLVDTTRDRDGQWSEYAEPVLRSGGFPRGRAKSPPRLDASGRPRDELLALLPNVVDTWEALASRREDIRLCPARARHFAFGYLTSSEWVRMCAIHTAHHLAIVRDIRGVAPPGEPRPTG